MRLITTRLLVKSTLVCCLSVFSAFSAFAQQSEPGNGQAIVNNPASLGARILGGAEADISDYPSLVALVSPGFFTPDQRLFCGGTLVAERWVLTAAHCVLDNSREQQPLQPELINVVAGISDLAQPEPVNEVKVLQVIVHPEYDPGAQLPPFDIALLELQSDTAAEVATLFTGDTDLYTGTPGFIAGWGAFEYISTFNVDYPTVLQDAIVPLVAHEDCNAPQSYDGILSASHLCAGYADGEIDACLGDSGGPLYLAIDGEQIQAGIVSFGTGCGLPLFYGIYTDISYHIPWLADYITVPYQSPELVASRIEEPETITTASEGSSASGGSASSDSDDGFLGKPGYPLLLAIALVLLARLTRVLPESVRSSGTPI